MYLLWPEQVIPLFASSEYATEAEHLWLLLLASIVFLVGQQPMLHGLVVKRPLEYVPTKFVHAAALVAALVAAIPRHGISGVVVALVGAHALQLVLVLLVNRFRVSVPRSASSDSTCARLV